MKFEVLIDEHFLKVNPAFNLTPADRKSVLSIANDFEDNSWRYNEFRNYIWDNVAQTALSKSERDALIDNSHSALTAAAANLRLTDGDKDPGKGSEIAEIVLYGLMKDHYKALSVVPKIFYKQNSNDYAKGADSVHIVVENGSFTIWFGEAKFLNSIEDVRLDKVVESVGNSLDTGKLRKENSIVTNIKDLDEISLDETMRKNIRDALSNKSSIDHLKPRLHVPILLLHECATTSTCKKLTKTYKDQIVLQHKERCTVYFSKQISKLSKEVSHYEQITFHVILFPIPSKKKIVSQFTKDAEHYRSK
jgi:hypothetical protein